MPKLYTEQHLVEMDDRIDAYLRGQMTKEEEHQFLSDCKNDKELKERAYMTALLVEALKDKDEEIPDELIAQTETSIGM